MPELGIARDQNPILGSRPLKDLVIFRSLETYLLRMDGIMSRITEKLCHSR